MSVDVDLLHDRLDDLGYYEVLGLAPEADFLEVRDAYYARAQELHPDRFVASSDEGLKKRVYTVYKRVTEAYGVLQDPELRARYDRGAAEGWRRLPAVERSRRLDAEERSISQPWARVYYRSAKAKLEAGRLGEAAIDLALGLSVEPAAPLERLRARLDALQHRPGGAP
jgi:curved DNA-binding protein CbpA